MYLDKSQFLNLSLKVATEGAHLRTPSTCLQSNVSATEVSQGSAVTRLKCGGK